MRPHTYMHNIKDRHTQNLVMCMSNICPCFLMCVLEVMSKTLNAVLQYLFTEFVGFHYYSENFKSKRINVTMSKHQLHSPHHAPKANSKH